MRFQGPDWQGKLSGGLCYSGLFQLRCGRAKPVSTESEDSMVDPVLESLQVQIYFFFFILSERAGAGPMRGRVAESSDMEGFRWLADGDCRSSALWESRGGSLTVEKRRPVHCWSTTFGWHSLIRRFYKLYYSSYYLFRTNKYHFHILLTLKTHEIHFLDPIIVYFLWNSSYYFVWLAIVFITFGARVVAVLMAVALLWSLCHFAEIWRSCWRKFGFLPKAF